MLKLTNLNVSYGGIHALRDICIEVGEGEIVTLIGANGAGKTSTLRAISGLVPVGSGTIEFEGKDLSTAARPTKFHTLVFLMCRKAGASLPT